MSSTHPTGTPRLVLTALWNLRMLGLFLVGPVVGVILGGWTFTMPVPLRWAGLGMFLLALSLLGILVRDEYGRLARGRGAGAGPRAGSR